MRPEDHAEAMAPLVDATAELRALGHDASAIGRLLLNGAAVVLGPDCGEEDFLRLAREMWRAKERQLAVIGLLDRIQASPEYRVRFGRKRKRPEVGEPAGVRGDAP